MKTTSNYGLKKPDGNEVVDIEDINFNTDVIDKKIKEIENKASNITVPVTSVNSKAGAVVLNAVDIKCKNGQSIETSLDDKALKSDLGNINDGSLDSSLKGKSLTEMAKMLFTNADNAQKGVSTVIGSPLSASDTLTSQQAKIQDLKNTFATNLTGKGQPSQGTETLNTLINKIPNISTGMKLNFLNWDIKGKLCRFTRDRFYTVKKIDNSRGEAYTYDMNGTLLSTLSHGFEGSGSYKERDIYFFDGDYISIERYTGSSAYYWNIYDTSNNFVKRIDINTTDSNFCYHNDKLFSNYKIYDSSGTLLFKGNEVKNSPVINSSTKNERIMAYNIEYGNINLIDLNNNTIFSNRYNLFENWIHLMPFLDREV